MLQGIAAICSKYWYISVLLTTGREEESKRQMLLPAMPASKLPIHFLVLYMWDFVTKKLKLCNAIVTWTHNGKEKNETFMTC